MFSGADKKSWEERLFFASYLLWLISAVLRLTMFRYMAWFEAFYAGMQIIAFLLLVILFFMEKRNTLKDVIGILLLLFCLFLALNSLNIYILPMALYVYFGADIDFQKILKCTLLVQTVIMAVVIFCSQVGIVEDVMWTTDTRVRHSLGYDYCAYPAHLLLFMSLIWFCIRKKITAIEMVIMLALNYLMYVLTDSRADLLLAVIGILGFAVWQIDFKQKWIQVIRAFFVEFGFVILAIVSIVLQAFYNWDEGFYSVANTALNGRLDYGNRAIQNYGLTLFGQKVTWVGQGRYLADPTLEFNYVDNAYLQMGITYGVIFLILLAIGFYLTGRYLIAHKEYKLSWALLMALAYGVLNAHLCMPVFDVFILLLGCCFKKDNEEDQLSVIQRFRRLTDKE